VVMSAAGSSGFRQTRAGRRFHPIGLGFVITLLAEIFAFVAVGHLIGYGWAILALIGVSAIGLAVFVRQTPRAWRQLRTMAAAGERPGPEVTRRLAQLVGAILIAMPGFLTAIAGAALFLPPVRMLAGRAVTGMAIRRMPSSMAGDLFGPRQVRVKVGKPGAEQDAGEPIEGEIL
jgi:UPF0716 protein FxsA